MPEAWVWLRAYVGVYAGTLIGHKQLILFIFLCNGATCRVHMRYVVAYVVPDVMGQPCPCAIFPHGSASSFAGTPSRRYPIDGALGICDYSGRLQVDTNRSKRASRQPEQQDQRTQNRKVRNSSKMQNGQIEHLDPKTFLNLESGAVLTQSRKWFI
jgi:hypothetical protein